MYDKNNIFYKIINGAIPAKIILQNNNAIAFHDINPQAKIHVLLIPKGQYSNIADFATLASVIEQTDFFNALSEIIKMLEIKKNGFRVISNCGNHAGQEVPHFHMHILGGEPLGKMLSK